jgi:hypothetical protein
MSRLNRIYVIKSNLRKRISVNLRRAPVSIIKLSLCAYKQKEEEEVVSFPIRDIRALIHSLLLTIA